VLLCLWSGSREVRVMTAMDNELVAETAGAERHNGVDEDRGTASAAKALRFTGEVGRTGVPDV